MKISRLRHVVELQRPIFRESESGKQVVSWQAVRKLYISLDGLGTEQIIGEQTRGTVLWSIKAYYAPDIKPECRFVMGSRVFHIISVVPAPADIDIFVDITAGEVVT